MTRHNFYGFGIALFLATAVLLASGLNANAQLRPWDSNNEVMIDLSVLGAGGNGGGSQPAIRGKLPATGTYTLPSLSRYGLLEPPRRVPRSQLLTRRGPTAGQYSGRQLLLPKVTLKRPQAKKRTRKKASRAKPKTNRQVARVQKPTRKLAPTKKTLQPPPKPSPRPTVKVAKALPVIEPPKIEAPKKVEPSKLVSAPPPPPAIELPKPEAKKVEAKPAPKPAVTKSETQVASRPTEKSADKAIGGEATSITFGPGDAKLTTGGMKNLDAMAANLNANQKQRMQLLAYAGDPNLSSSKARRLSLSRALAVRSYLIKKGIRGTRIDVRALGNKVPSGLPNRVEMRVLRR